MEIPKERKCTRCEVVKPLTSEYFYPQKGYRYELTRWCKDCRTKYSTEWNREKRNEYRAENARKTRGLNLDKFRVKEFAREMKKYGVTVEWFRDKLIEQNGVCAMCKHLSRRFGKLQRLQVDHDHACCDLKTKSCGNCLRGLLCGDCNMLLSYLEKFIGEMCSAVPKRDTWTENALLYLKRYGSLTI